MVALNFPARRARGIGAPALAYRDASEYLFQTSGVALLESRLPLGSPNSAYDYPYQIFGPTWDYVDKHSEWMWDTPGGDWIDASQVRQGSTAWATLSLPQIALQGGEQSGDDVPKSYEVDTTTALQFVQANGRWAAFRLTCTGTRVFAGMHHATAAYRPSIDVTYTDASTATLACRINTRANSGAPTTTSAFLDRYQTPILMEFDKPTKAITSATLNITCLQQYWSGGATMSWWVLDPPLRGALVGTTGIAAGAGSLDSGLSSNQAAIFVHRYVDGTTQTDFISASNYSVVNNSFDPALWGGATDTGKLPHVGQGKWVNGSADGGNLTLVDSSYTSDGFVPLASGLGAIRTQLAAQTYADGDTVGYTGTLACVARMFLPEPIIGLQQDISVRYYMRAHSARVGAYEASQRKHVYNAAAVYRWTDRSGKGGISPCHDTSEGGFSGTSGGGYGWQLRDSWYQCDANLGGPDEDGLAVGWHLFDFGANNPAGHRYGSTNALHERWGHLGGFGGLLKYDRWYLIEKRIKLNSVDVLNGADGRYWSADGILQTYVDGRLVYEETGLVFRSLPILGADAANSAGSSSPIREIGHRDILLNVFHGGRTPALDELVFFFSGVVVADGSYIGPMNGV